MPTRLPRSAQHADASGGEHEVSAVNRFRPSQRAANTLRKCPLEQISRLPFTARIRSTLRSALAATCSGDSPPRTAVAEKFPGGPAFQNLGSAQPFVFSVVPFDEIGVDPRCRSEACQFTGSICPPERAGQDLREL